MAKYAWVSKSAPKNDLEGASFELFDQSILLAGEGWSKACLQAFMKERGCIGVAFGEDWARFLWLLLDLEKAKVEYVVLASPKSALEQDILALISAKKGS